MTPELRRAYALTSLWVAFGLYATIFPAAAMIAGKCIQEPPQSGSELLDIAVGVLAPLPFLQSLGLAFFAAAVHDLMASRHYPGNAPTFAAILIFSVLLVAIGFYSAVAEGGSGLSDQALVLMQAAFTMAGITVAMVLKFSQTFAGP